MRCAAQNHTVSGNLDRCIAVGSMPEKGLSVLPDYDRAALDAAYDQAAYAPNREQLIKRRITDGARSRHRIGEPARVIYGAAEIEQLDIYLTGDATAPVFIFIHGAARRGGRSKDFAMLAEMFIAAGAHYIMLDIPWVPDVGGSLMVLADQVRHAIGWVHQNAARRQGWHVSPIRQLDRLARAADRCLRHLRDPEFQRQKREFAAAVEAAGKKGRLLVGEHYHHFELPETLRNPHGLRGRAALDLMGLRVEFS